MLSSVLLHECLLCITLLLLTDCMLIAAYLFELASHTQLHSHDIHTPGPLVTGMKIEIVVRYLFNLLLLANSNRLLGQAIGRAAARFHLHKGEGIAVAADQIDLTGGEAHVARQHDVPTLGEKALGDCFAASRKALVLYQTYHREDPINCLIQA